MDYSWMTDITVIGGAFITAWILIDRVFDYMFSRNKH